MSTIEREWIGSPNRSQGRRGYRPEAIVVHIIEGSLAAADSWFKTTESQVSAHYAVGIDGEIHQYVAEGDTAWHAGRVDRPSWDLLRPGVNPNFYTIGIEHEGKPGTPWTEAMYAASSALIADVANRWGIPLDRKHVIGHYQIYAKKSFCPGSGVEIERLIALARAHLLAADRYTIVATAGSVTTRTAVNIREGAPTTHARVVRSVKAATPLAFVAWTSNGESVHGNAHWYRTPEGDFFWAGATTAPVPAAPQLEPVGG